MISRPTPLPPGWREQVEPSSGLTFYVDEQNHTTQWERPPPPPPLVLENVLLHKMVEVAVPGPGGASSVRTLIGRGRLTIEHGRQMVHEREEGQVWTAALDEEPLICWWASPSMIGVATTPHAFLEIPSLAAKRVAATAAAATVVRVQEGPPPPGSVVVVAAYTPAPAAVDAAAAPAAAAVVVDEQWTSALATALTAALNIRKQEPSAAARSAAAAIEWGGQALSNGLLGAADLATSGLEAALSKFKLRVEPRATPATISANTDAAARRLQAVAGTTETVSAGVCDGIKDVASAAGRELGDQLSKQPSTKPPSATKAGAKAIGSASLGAAGDVLGAADTACREVVASASAVTSAAIGHRYGDDAERVAEKSLDAFKSAAYTALNVVSLGGKAVAKSVAFSAAKGGASTALAADDEPARIVEAPQATEDETQQPAVL